MEIYLVRHALSEGNVKSIIQGKLDFPLSDEGKIQASRLTHKLPNCKHVFSSPQKRAVETCIIALNKKPIIIDGLREMNLGILEGKNQNNLSNEEYRILNMAQIDPDFHGHNGESMNELVQRSITTLKSIVKEVEMNNGDCVIIFTHFGVIGSIIYYLTGNKVRPKDIPNTSITRIEKTNEKWELISVIE